MSLYDDYDLHDFDFDNMGFIISLADKFSKTAKSERDRETMKSIADYGKKHRTLTDAQIKCIERVSKRGSSQSKRKYY